MSDHPTTVPLAVMLSQVLQGAPEGWGRTLTMEDDRLMGGVKVTLQDYHLDEERRVADSRLLPHLDVEDAKHADAMVSFLLARMEYELDEEHRR